MAENTATENAETVAGAGSETEKSAATPKGIALSSGRGGYVGVKAGMTQFFSPEGDAYGVTVIELVPNVITQVKTEAKEGNSSVQIGVLPKKENRCIRAEKGHAKKSGKPGFYYYQEFPLEKGSKVDASSIGSELSIDFIKEGDWVDVRGVSKGKGFQGVVKRYHFAGGFKSHGASLVHRSLGSIGMRTSPGRVFKNKKMAGHMGHETVSVQNLRVVKIDAERRVLLVHGSVPGPETSLVSVRKSIKKLNSKQAKAGKAS